MPSKGFSYLTANLEGRCPALRLMPTPWGVLSVPFVTERGLSQVQLAEATGFIQAWISHVERGRRNPSWNNVVRLAEGLGVSVSELAKRAEACAQAKT